MLKFVLNMNLGLMLVLSFHTCFLLAFFNGLYFLLIGEHFTSGNRK